MTNKAIIHTKNAPAAIGTYSQAVKVNNTVYLSGQIPLDPKTMQLVDGGIRPQIQQVFENITAVCEASGGDLNNIVKLNIFLTDLSHFPVEFALLAVLGTGSLLSTALGGRKLSLKRKNFPRC